MRLSGKIYYKDKDGDELEIATLPIDSLCFTLVYKEDTVIVPKEEVKQLINYLQNWLDTGKFGGERKEENDS